MARTWRRGDKDDFRAYGPKNPRNRSRNTSKSEQLEADDFRGNLNDHLRNLNLEDLYDEDGYEYDDDLNY